MASGPSPDELRQRALQSAGSLLAVVEPTLDGATMQIGSTAVLGAAVAHEASLLRSLCVLVSVREFSASGLVVRAAWETWVVGQYLAYGGVGAVDTLKGQSDKRIGIIRKRSPSGATEHQADSSLSRALERDLPLEQMLQRVVKLREEQGNPMSDGDAQTYDTLYRLTSLLDGHAGFSLLSRYQRFDDRQIVIDPRPKLDSTGADVGIVTKMLFQLAYEWTSRTDGDMTPLSEWASSGRP